MVFIREPRGQTHIRACTQMHGRGTAFWTGRRLFAYNVLKQSPAAAGGGELPQSRGCRFNASLWISRRAKCEHSARRDHLACFSFECFKGGSVISSGENRGSREVCHPAARSVHPQRDSACVPPTRPPPLSSESKALPPPQEFQGLDEDSQMTTVLGCQ